MSILTHNKNLEEVSGILFGFIGIPIFSIILPLWLAKKWQLPYSFWPKSKRWVLVAIILLIYIFLSFFEPIKMVLNSGISIRDFAVHYISSMFFHVAYYPLFAVFMFPIFRKNFGLIKGLVLTSLAFALYHLAQFHFFPAGTTISMQIFLFVLFITLLLLYLWSESIILMALTHSICGAVGLIAGGKLFNDIDIIFYLAIIYMVVLFGYMIQQELKYRKRVEEFDADWWLQISIKDK
ncbi:MAG: CPBP family glutamic-type intramembrane protease [Candidatus Firestonebacteria bacterium]